MKLNYGDKVSFDYIKGELTMNIKTRLGRVWSNTIVSFSFVLLRFLMHYWLMVFKFYLLVFGKPGCTTRQCLRRQR